MSCAPAAGHGRKPTGLNAADPGWVMEGNRIMIVRRRAAAALVCTAAIAVLSTSCTADRATGAAAAGTTTTAVGAGHAACAQQPTTDPVESTPVPGVASDWSITSFDGTKIRAHWFPVDGATAAVAAPTVLMGPGWSQPGATLEKEAVLLGSLGIAPLNDAGYNVLTWDPRGFGKSEGVVQINDAAYEGRDVQALLDWVATQPVAKLDRPGDPRVGMVGASYGGGIQLTVSAIDCRVDAIVPTVAWHSLETSLYKAQTLKAGWAGLLSTAATTFGGHLDPHIPSAAQAGVANVTISDEDIAWFRDRGPGDLVDKVGVPTLFLHGTVDTLFTLDEAITNYRALRDHGVPTAMIWFCGGHGTCLTDAGSTDLVNRMSFAWLARYLKDDVGTDLGSPVDVVDQHGERWTADDYPGATQSPITAHGDGTLALTAASVSGPATPRPGGSDLLSSSVVGITPAKAATAVDVQVDPGQLDALAIGAPKLSVTYTGTAATGAAAGSKPTRAFAQLVDDDTGLVLGNQITPFEITLDGASHTAQVDLEVIAQHVQPGHTLTLQIVASTVAYAVPQLGGSITFDKIELAVPVAKGFTKV